jgi:hypothetical protein
MQTMEQKALVLDAEIKQYKEKNTTAFKKLGAKVNNLLTLWKTEYQKQLEQVPALMLSSGTKSKLDKRIKRIKVESCRNQH